MSCIVSVWGRYAKKPSYYRVNLLDNQTLVLEFNGFAPFKMNDGDLPQIVAFNSGLNAVDRRGGYSTPDYPAMKLPFQVSVTAYIESKSRTGTSRYDPIPLILWLHHPYMPQYKVEIYTCEAVYRRAYTVLLTGAVAINDLSRQLLIAMETVLWAVAALTFTMTVLTLLLCSLQPVSPETLLSFSASLLFALPTVCTLWPAAPPSSTVFDVLNIYAQVMLIAFAVILQLCCLMHKALKTVKTAMQTNTHDDKSVVICNSA